MLDTPILFIVFNRLDTTKRVLAAIRRAQPRQLFIAADGPRHAKNGEYDNCLQVRSLIDNGIDWPCEVHRLYREQNLGCGRAVSSAINWFFDHVDQGIILEDDILPDVTFFDFCQLMLNHYSANDNTMHICGYNLQCGIKRGSESYYFSKLPGIWGWATWKRAWIKYSFNLFSDSDDEIRKVVGSTLLNNDDVSFFSNAMIKTKTGIIDTWDYQWVYTLFKNKGICIVPQYNLIQNIGFSNEGTHTHSVPFWYKYLVNKPTHVLTYSSKIEINQSADNFYLSLTMGRRSVEIFYIKLLYLIRHSLFMKKSNNNNY